MSFSLNIVADSVSPMGCRLITPLTTFPRYILAELNTHRMLTRNSASSRAIPFKKMVAAVEENPFIPMAWMKEHKGMQGTEYFNDTDVCESPDGSQTYTRTSVFKQTWLEARDAAIKAAEQMTILGLTKQMCNRLLEPFMYHTALLSATEWENFFALRADGAADIHISKLAEMMLESFNNNTPKQLKEGEWHIPFGDKIDTAENAEMLAAIMLPDLKASNGADNADELIIKAKIKIATARCAQTSYTVVGDGEKEMNFDSLVKLHNRLATSKHWSPFEHCARVMTMKEWFVHHKVVSMPHDFYEQIYSKKYQILHHFDYMYEDGKKIYVKEYGWCGNFRGYTQYRKLFASENQFDSRLLKKANL